MPDFINPRQMTRNLLWSFLGQGWPIILTLATTPFIISRLGVDLYGVYVLVGVVVEYFAFLQFGMADASVKYMAEHLARGDRSRLEETFGTAFFFQAAVGAIGTAAMYLSAGLLADRVFSIAAESRNAAVLAIQAGSIGFFIAMSYNFVGGALRVFGRFGVLNQINSLVGTLQALAVVLLLYSGYSLLAIVISNSLVLSLGLCASMLSLRRLTGLSLRPAWKPATLRQLFRFGGCVTVSGIMNPILTDIEKVFLTAFQSVAALAFYAVPFSLISRLAVLPGAFSSVLYPVFSYHHGLQNGRANASLLFRSTLYIFTLYGAAVIFILVYGRAFLESWVGRDIAEKSATVLFILAGAGLANALAYPSITLLRGAGKPHIPATFHVAETILYVPLAWVLISNFGIEGAALAWLSRVSLDMALLQAAACRELQIPLASWCNRLLSKGVPPLALCGILLWALRGLHLPNFQPIHFTGCLAVFMIYGYVFWTRILDARARASLSWRSQGTGYRGQGTG